MKNIKILEVEKQDVERLSNTELENLVSWGEHKGFDVVNNISESAIATQLKYASSDPDTKDEDRVRMLTDVAFLRRALAFLLLAPERARQELKGRNK